MRMPQVVAFLAAVLMTARGDAIDDARFVVRASLTLSTEPSRPGSPGQRFISDLAYSPDGKWLAVAGERTEGWGRTTGELKLWDAATGKEALYLQKLPRRLQAVAFSPDSKWIAIGDGDYTEAGEVALVDRASGRVAKRLTTPENTPSWTFGVAFCPDGKLLARSSSSFTRDWCKGELRLWDLSTGDSRLISKWDEGTYRGLALSSDGSLIAVGAGTRTGEVRVFETAGGRQRYARAGHRPVVESVAFSPDGRQLASGGMDGSVKVWDSEAGRERCALKLFDEAGRRGRALDLAFAADGKMLAVAFGDWTRGNRFGEVQLWDIPSQSYRNVLYNGHSEPAHILAFSPDGKQLAVGMEAGKIETWDRRQD